MPRLLSDLFDPFISFIFPAACTSCKSGRSDLRYTPACKDCWDRTDTYSRDSLLCHRCGVSFGRRKTERIVYCGKCDGHSYDRAIACGPYEKALRASVIHLKDVPRIFPELRQRMAMTLNDLIDENFDMAVPVPLSAGRLHERGFNQAEVIARACAKHLRIPLDNASLRRVRETSRNRALMDARARETSVEGAFDAARPKLVIGRKILLVDDVLTSGATASNCAEALKKSGAAKVTVFTLARAVLDR